MNLIENDFTAGCKNVLADAPGTTANFQHEIVKMDDDMEALALRLAAEAPDAMAFSDDRMASEVLKACTKIIPHFWEKTKVVSSDNLGWKSVLPNQVVRILFDPKMLGEAIMTSMAALLDGRPGANSVVLIKPKLVE